MRTAPEKKFLIIAPIVLPAGAYYWCKPGCGNTDDINQAWRFGEKAALELVKKEPLLKMIPAPL